MLICNGNCQLYKMYSNLIQCHLVVDHSASSSCNSFFSIMQQASKQAKKQSKQAQPHTSFSPIPASVKSSLTHFTTITMVVL
jgi:hypothetical protein